MEKYTLFAGVLLASACVEIKEDTASDVTDTSEDVVTVDPTFGVSWGDSSVSLSVTDGADGATYYWGITENGGDCGDACWTGEDCFMGYDLDSGDNLLFCHPVGATGVELSYGATGGDTEAGVTTTFGGAQFSTVVTYIVDDRSSADAPCWTWGADTNYYNGYEKTCTAM